MMLKSASLLACVPLALGLVLAGCGSKRDLQPAPGTSLPPAAYGRQAPQSSAELLKVNPEAMPERNVELRRQSEKRADDPFDLPPEG